VEGPEAGHAEFRIRGLDEQSIRRPRQRAPQTWTSIVVPVVAAVWLAGSSPGTVAPDVPVEVGAADSSEPGSVVLGSRVLIVADNSGSMRNDTRRIRVRDEQVASLSRAHNVVGDLVWTDGWAISSRKPRFSFLQPLEDAVAREQAVEAVYFISDFDVSDDVDNDMEGLQRLRGLLGDRHIRLYLSTVNQPVPAPYAQLAGESGGLVISR
jgi:hypothetical protein